MKLLRKLDSKIVDTLRRATYLPNDRNEKNRDTNETSEKRENYMIRRQMWYTTHSLAEKNHQSSIQAGPNSVQILCMAIRDLLTIKSNKKIYALKYYYNACTQEDHTTDFYKHTNENRRSRRYCCFCSVSHCWFDRG